MNSNSTVLVTGVAGFIGFHLAKRLCEEGLSVVGIDNLSDYYDTQLKKDRLNQLKKFSDENLFKFYKVDIANDNDLNEVLQKYQFELIINLAAQAGVRYSLENPREYIRSNIDGFLNILEGAKVHKINKVIYASSSSVYGGNEKLPFTEMDKVDTPVSLYAATKKSNELMAHTYSHLYNIQTIGLRFFTVYGPWGRPDMALHIFTKNIVEGKPIQVYNFGEHSRSFTYIDDIIEGIWRLINYKNKKIENYSIYNIGGENTIALMDYINEIENALSKKGQYNFLPMQLGDVEKTVADSKLLEEIIEFSPKTSIQLGIKKFVDWYKHYYEFS